jgi:hypothetical protein
MSMSMSMIFWNKCEDLNSKAGVPLTTAVHLKRPQRLKRACSVASRGMWPCGKSSSFRL